MRQYFHSGIGREILFLKASELYVSNEYVLATLLGSCVSVILWDPINHLVGMNHFVNAQLINKKAKDFDEFRYGDASTERLIQLMQEKGSFIGNLKARVVGGANMIDRSLLSDQKVIEENIAIALLVLSHYKIPIVGRDLGGEKARWIFAFPKSGRTLVWTEKEEDITKGKEYREI
jgi:chemotaxis protein CheD